VNQKPPNAQRPNRSRDFVGAAVGSIPLVLILAVLLLGGFLGRAYAQEPTAQDPKNGIPPGTKAGNGKVEIGEGKDRVFAGDGCVEIGDFLSVGSCGKDRDDEASPEVPETTMLEGTDLQFEGTSITRFDPDGTGSASPNSASPQPVSQPEEASPSPAPGDGRRPGISDGGGGQDGVGSAGDCAAVGPMEQTHTVTVERVTDGDTVEISEPIKGTRDVRLIGVDTPETVDPEEKPEPFGEEASTFTEKALEGETVELELGEDAKDDYDRLLAYAWTEDDGEAAMFNEALLAGGYGELLVIEPNDAYEECLAAAEELARSQDFGIWGLVGDEPSSPDRPSPDPSEDDTGETQPEVPSEEPTEEPTEDASPQPTEEPATEDPDVLPTAFGTEQPESTTASPPQPSAEPTAAPGETTYTAPAPEEPEAFGVLPPAPEEAPDTGVSPDVSGGTLPEGQLPEVASSPSPPTAFEASPSPSPSTEQYASAPPGPEGPAQQPEIVLPDSGGVYADAPGATRPVAYLTPLGVVALCAGAAILSFCAVRRAFALRGREGAGGRG